MHKPIEVSAQSVVMSGHNMRFGKCRQWCPQCAAEKAKSKAGDMRAKNSTPEERQRAQELRASGLSLEIAEIMGRSFSSIRYWCDKDQTKKVRSTSKNWVHENRDTHRQITRDYAKTEMGSMVVAASTPTPWS